MEGIKLENLLEALEGDEMESQIASSLLLSMMVEAASKDLPGAFPEGYVRQLEIDDDVVLNMRQGDKVTLEVQLTQDFESNDDVPGVSFSLKVNNDPLRHGFETLTGSVTFLSKSGLAQMVIDVDEGDEDDGDDQPEEKVTVH